MTPEKALAILEGKIPRTEPPVKNTEDLQPPAPEPKKSKPKQQELPRALAYKAGRIPEFIKILVIVLVMAVVVAVYLWRKAASLEAYYKKGFNDGVVSMTANLTAAQRQIEGQLAQISQLQHDLGSADTNILQLQHEVIHTRMDLESTVAQKERLSERLTALQDSIPSKINAVQQPLENKIKKITGDYKSKVNDLETKLHSAQWTSREEEKQLGEWQKVIAQKEQERDQAEQAAADKSQMLAEIKKHADDQDKQISHLEEGLKSMILQRDQAVDSLKAAQSSPPNQTSMCRSSS